MGRDAFLEREPYLRRVLDAFEAGRLEPYEYTRRVLAINAAATSEQMAAVADADPGVPADGSGAPDEPARTLDAVDLALLRARPGTTRRGGARYGALVFVFVVFAVLLGLGLWLGVHAHALSSPSGTVWSSAVVASPAL